MGELELAPGILEWPKHNAEQHLAAFLPLPHFAHFPHFRPLNSEKGVGVSGIANRQQLLHQAKLPLTEFPWRLPSWQAPNGNFSSQVSWD